MCESERTSVGRVEGQENKSKEEEQQQQTEGERKNHHTAIMSTIAGSRPQQLGLELSIPVPSDGGGLWVRQHQQPLQDQHTVAPDQDQELDPAQPDTEEDLHDQRRQSRPRHLSISKNNNELFVLVNPNLNSSSSDIETPLTPTFSHHGGVSSSHLRYASSTSSLDLQQSLSTCSDSPSASPAQAPSNQTQNAASLSPVAPPTAKRQLPDVQEDPLERDEDDEPTVTRLTDDEQSDSLWNCLCRSLRASSPLLFRCLKADNSQTGDSPCVIHNDMVQSADWTHSADHDISHFDYDMGFLSDGDVESVLHPSKERTGADSPLTGLTMRLGTRFPTFGRFRSTKRRHRAFTAASEASLDLPPALSRATSTSRSSSLSAPSRNVYDRSNEPPLPPTPALSFYEYESTDSIPGAIAIDIEKANVRESIERERALATTPLLPPLLTEAPSISSMNQSQQPSPLQSPTVAPQLGLELTSPPAYATPPLSTKPSISSFRPPIMTSLSSPVVATSEVVVTIPNLLEQHDAWSDRLGHANFTILPKPYNPNVADYDSLLRLRADWDLARVNYTKHIMRTGEHYGARSPTYALTEAKWAESERDWKIAHDTLVERVLAVNPGLEAQLLRDRLQEDSRAGVPRMLDADGKFPDLGDEEIVGPMVRDAVMARDPATEGDNSARKFFKNLAGKVGLRK